MRDIPHHFSVPAVINLVEKGKTPMFPNKELQAMGYKIVFYGNALLKASMFGVMKMLDYVKEHDTTGWLRRPADDHFCAAPRSSAKKPIRNSSRSISKAEHDEQFDDRCPDHDDRLFVGPR